MIQMEIKSLSATVIFLVAMTILGPSVIGVGEMADNQDDNDSGWIKKLMKNNDWQKKILDLFNIKKLIGFMSSKDSNSENVGSDSEDFNSEGFSSEEFNSISHICGNGIIDTDSQSTEQCEPPNTATCDAFCHIIPPPPPPPPPQASIDLKLDNVLVDPNEEVTGDEYFDNLITECSFHSAESIEGKVCIACKVVDTKVEPCEDLFLSFTQFPHGTILGNTEGFPNAVIPGVTITAVANTHSGGGKNAAIIFDGDTPGDSDENPTPDPDLRADGNQGDANNLDGICPNCAGKHMVIIAENTAGGSDGIVDSPDDNAEGGTQTWVFDEPWFVRSFDFVDYDNPDRNGKARAYDNPQCSGTPVATADIKASPNGGDGSVQTILLNANNVRCLKFEYKDSGGITNVDLECIKKLDDSGVLSEGTLVLPDGYVKSTSLSIPLEHGVDVQKAVGVKIDLTCPTDCPQVPTVTTKVLTSGDVEVTYKQSSNLNDNSYGANAIGWGTKGHTFKDLHNSDNLQFQFKNSGGQVVLDFVSDYITTTPGNTLTTPAGVIIQTPSHYASLGPFGGDGSMITGTNTWVKEYRSSFADNLNNNGYFVNGVQTPATQSVADLLLNSPPTISSTSYTLPGGSPFTAWNFINEYKVIISKDAFPGGFVAGGYSVSFPSMHNSPAKKCPASPPEPKVIFSTGFEDETELGKWHKDSSRTTTPNSGNIIFGLDNDGQPGGNPSGPKSGTKYLGGSGDIDDSTSPIIDPAWAAYNRDSINISGHTSIMLSLWYSYEDTETEDEFALYYRVDGGAWQEILNVDPAIGNGNQKAWQQLQVPIPAGNSLEVEFRWETSQNSEHVMIDDMQVTGIPT